MLCLEILFVILRPLTALWAQENSNNFKEMPPFALSQGEQHLLSTGKIEKFSIGGPSIRGHLLNPHQLLLKAVAEGSTDLWIWRNDNTVEHRTLHVQKNAIQEIKPELEKALRRLESTSILYSGKGVILSGFVTNDKEAATIRALSEGYPDLIQNETEPSEEYLKIGAQRIREWLKILPNTSSLRLEIQNSDLWLMGSLSSPIQRQTLRKKALSLFPLLKTQLETLPDESPTVHFKIFLLELKKTRFGSFGIQWPSAIENAFQVSSLGIQDLLQLQLTLQTLEGEGSGKILSSPELVVRAPGEAELFAGGELPLKVQNRFYSNVQWKNYGLTLKLKVTHSTAEQVRLEIFTEVSHLDTALSIGEVPGLQTNRLQTQVDAHFGAPLFLSGLLQQNTRNHAKGFPLLRQLPLLGPLFGSEDYLNEKSELVALLVPSKTLPPLPSVPSPERMIPRGVRPLPRNWISPAEEKALRESKNFPWNVFGKNVFERGILEGSLLEKNTDREMPKT